MLVFENYAGTFTQTVPVCPGTTSLELEGFFTTLSDNYSCVALLCINSQCTYKNPVPNQWTVVAARLDNIPSGTASVTVSARLNCDNSAGAVVGKGAIDWLNIG
jgi:hypothetical protein